MPTASMSARAHGARSSAASCSISASLPEWSVGSTSASPSSPAQSRDRDLRPADVDADRQCDTGSRRSACAPHVTGSQRPPRRVGQDEQLARPSGRHGAARERSGPGARPNARADRLALSSPVTRNDDLGAPRVQPRQRERDARHERLQPGISHADHQPRALRRPPACRGTARRVCPSGPRPSSRRSKRGRVAEPLAQLRARSRRRPRPGRARPRIRVHVGRRSAGQRAEQRLLDHAVSSSARRRAARSARRRTTACARPGRRSCTAAASSRRRRAASTRR